MVIAMLENLIVYGGISIGAFVGVILGAATFEGELKGIPARALCTAAFVGIGGAIYLYRFGGANLEYGASGLLLTVPAFYLANEHYVPWSFGVGERSKYSFSPAFERGEAKVGCCAVGIYFGAFVGWLLASWASLHLGPIAAIAVATAGVALATVPALGTWYFLKLVVGLFFRAIAGFCKALLRPKGVASLVSKSKSGDVA
jgi:hypothetical protein